MASSQSLENFDYSKSVFEPIKIKFTSNFFHLYKNVVGTNDVGIH